MPPSTVGRSDRDRRSRLNWCMGPGNAAQEER
jgi:hypothetical protein